MPTVPDGVAITSGRGTAVVQPDSGHIPWIDDPGRFVATVEESLG
jgi:hypothetical protein